MKKRELVRIIEKYGTINMSIKFGKGDLTNILRVYPLCEMCAPSEKLYKANNELCMYNASSSVAKSLFFTTYLLVDHG